MKKSNIESLKKNITFLEKVNAEFQVKLKKEQHKSSRYEGIITELKSELKKTNSNLKKAQVKKLNL